jgi:ATP-binding cassette subfamily B protein
MSARDHETRHAGREAARDAAQRARLLRRAVAFALPHRWTVTAILGLTLFTAAIGALEPLILKQVFDGLAARDLRPFWAALVLLLCTGVAREALSGLANWLTWKTRIGVHYALLEVTIGKLHSMPLHVQRSEGVGAQMTRLERSIQGFLAAVTQVLFQVLPALAYLGIALGLMLSIDWRLALVVLAFAPLPALIALRAAPEQVERERSLLDAWARIYGRFNEVLSGILTVRSFAMEDTEKQRFLRDVDAANRTVIRGVGIDTGTGAAANVVVALARIATIGYGGWLVLQGEITLGTLVAFLGYVGGLFAPVQGLSGTYQALRRAAVSLEQIFSIIDVQEYLGDSPGAVELPHVRGAVRFENVVFGYGLDFRPVLDGLELEVAAGERVAIVGPSGAGKTTLVSLLLRFHDPLSGRILIDGHDIREFKQSSLRRSIGIVLQDALLFDESVRANIAYGRAAATQAEIETAARAANAHEFVMRLPDGYDTRVGERGARLSVGERQRIAIARALVKDPRIVVLDEATSALDVETQRAVQEALEHLTAGRTTLVIAHRLETVAHADRIVVLRAGRVAEAGRHSELVRAGGYYSELVRTHSRGLLRE